MSTRWENGPRAWFERVIFGGRKPVGIDAIDWCRNVENYGTGELPPTSMDRDGTNMHTTFPSQKPSTKQ